MIYHKIRKELVAETIRDREQNKVAPSKLKQLYRTAVANSVVTNRPLAYCLFSEMVRFNSILAVEFLSTGIGNDFFNGCLSNHQVFQLVFKFYHPNNNGEFYGSF